VDSTEDWQRILASLTERGFGVLHEDRHEGLILVKTCVMRK
jgi:hypothetical protein